jgi:hypothetical protein
MYPFHFETLRGSRYEDLLREATVERMIRASTGQEPRRTWALSLGRGLVQLGHTFQHFGQPRRTFSPFPSE